MTIHEFELDDDVKDASADELLDTLNEFMQKHEENVEAYRELESDFSDTEDEVEAKQDTIDTMKTYFAEKVAETAPLFDADEVAERYDAEDLMEKAGAAETEFSEEEDADPSEETKFDEKPQKSREEPGESSPDQKSSFVSQAADDYERLTGRNVE